MKHSRFWLAATALCIAATFSAAAQAETYHFGEGQSGMGSDHPRKAKKKFKKVHRTPAGVPHSAEKAR